VRAQAMRAHIGFLSLREIKFDGSSFDAAPLRDGLAQLGWVEGSNVVFEWRSAQGDVDRLPALAAELVRIKVDVIVVAGSQATAAAQAATRTIPIVMGSTGDPLGSGFVKSLARPGGNITGLSNLSGETGPKQLEILASIVPKLHASGVLANPTNSSHGPIVRSIEAAGRTAGIRIVTFQAETLEQIEAAFASMGKQRLRAAIVATDAVLNTYSRRMAELALKHRIASMFTARNNVVEGGLVSYGQNLRDNYRRAAAFVDKILRGANPAELPVEQTTKFDLVFNRRTAKTLGLTIPHDLLTQATEVID